MRAQLLCTSSDFFTRKYGRLQLTKIFVLIQKSRTGKESSLTRYIIYDSLISSQPTKAYVTHKEMKSKCKECVDPKPMGQGLWKQS